MARAPRCLARPCASSSLASAAESCACSCSASDCTSTVAFWTMRERTSIARSPKSSWTASEEPRSNAAQSAAPKYGAKARFEARNGGVPSPLHKRPTKTAAVRAAAESYRRARLDEVGDAGRDTDDERRATVASERLLQQPRERRVAERH
eukprot:6289890-Prymnesium_polylepis.1